MGSEKEAYHRPLPLTTELLEQMCSPRVFREAERYAKSTNVTDKLRVGSTLSAKFHGTRGIYMTRLDLSERQFSFECTCPLASSRKPCKHVIALGLTWLYQPEDFSDLELTLVRLSRLTKAEIITLLRKVATRMPEIVPLLNETRLD